MWNFVYLNRFLYEPAKEYTHSYVDKLSKKYSKNK